MQPLLMTSLCVAIAGGKCTWCYLQTAIVMPRGFNPTGNPPPLAVPCLALANIGCRFITEVTLRLWKPSASKVDGGRPSWKLHPTQQCTCVQCYPDCILIKCLHRINSIVQVLNFILCMILRTETSFQARQPVSRVRQLLRCIEKQTTIWPVFILPCAKDVEPGESAQEGENARLDFFQC